MCSNATNTCIFWYKKCAVSDEKSSCVSITQRDSYVFGSFLGN